MVGKVAPLQVLRRFSKGRRMTVVDVTRNSAGRHERNSQMTKSYLAKGLTGLALAGTLVAGGMLSVSAPDSAAAGDYEQINAYNSNDLVVAMADPFTKNDDQAVMAVYDAMAYNGQWIREAVVGQTDTYTFRNRWSNQCLDTQNGNSTTAGT